MRTGFGGSTNVSLQVRALMVAALAATALPVLANPAERSLRPSLLIITVDALRQDHLSAYGYERPTSPNIDILLTEGLRFERAWTPEPLTGPAMCAMITGLPPHVHGATRNGLRMQDGLDSLPRILARNGYATAAFVGTWTLKNNLTLLGHHFDRYGERLRRRRWFGLLNSEATGEDLTDDAIGWLEDFSESEPNRPFFLWVHYVEPHAPYRFHGAYAERLGVNDDKLTRRDRYDTEIAAVDESIRRLVAGLGGAGGDAGLVIVFTADHGESLGEHDFWGHGRYLYEPSLRIPLGIVWKGHIEPHVVTNHVSLLDLAPTLLEMAGIEVPEGFAGRSWAALATGDDSQPEEPRCYQAHRGAVHGGTHDDERARSKGLLAVAVIRGDRKEILDVKREQHMIFDLVADPAELKNLVEPSSRPSPELLRCLGEISEGLGSLDRLATEKLDDETVEQLRALGYLD